MEQQNLKDLFHNACDLNGFSFNLKYMKSNLQENRRLWKKVKGLGGKITSSHISAETIIVLEEIQDRMVDNLFAKYSQYNKAFVFEKNTVRIHKNTMNKIKEESKEEPKGGNQFQNEKKKYKQHDEFFSMFKQGGLRIIRVEDLEQLVNKVEKEALDKHYALGLPRQNDLKSTISIITPHHEKSKQQLHYHTFPQLEVNNKKFYDFPRYYSKSPEGFACIMSYEEKKQVQLHERKIKNSTLSIMKTSNIDCEENIQEPPIPHRSNKFCNLCNKTFDDYLEHIKSAGHLNRKKSCGCYYAQIEKTFESIRQFWKSRETESGLSTYNYNNITLRENKNNLHPTSISVKDTSLHLNQLVITNKLHKSPPTTKVEVIDLTEEDLINQNKKIDSTRINSNTIDAISKCRSYDALPTPSSTKILSPDDKKDDLLENYEDEKETEMCDNNHEEEVKNLNYIFGVGYKDCNFSKAGQKSRNSKAIKMSKECELDKPHQSEIKLMKQKRKREYDNDIQGHDFIGESEEVNKNKINSKKKSKSNESSGFVNPVTVTENESANGKNSTRKSARSKSHIKNKNNSKPSSEYTQTPRRFTRSKTDLLINEFQDLNCFYNLICQEDFIKLVDKKNQK